MASTHQSEPRATRTANHPDLRQTGLNPDYWYPLARSSALKKGGLLAVSFAGNPIVLGRTENGEVFALEDRCAHRQVPLSMGVLDGSRLRCGYHAWEYDTNGRVAKIPYLVKGGPRPPRCVRNFPCREACGHVFVFTGAADAIESAVFPAIPAWSDPEFKTMYFSREVGCHYSFMHENLLDMNHQFLHRRLLGGLQATLIDRDQGEGWIQGRYRFESGGRRVVGADFLMAGADDRNAEAVDVMTIRTEYPYQTLSLKRSADNDPAMHLWAVYIPVDKAQRINRSFGMLMVKKPPIPGLIHLFWPFMRWFTERVFAEDRMIVIAEQKAYDEQGGDWNNEVFPLILDLRQLLLRQGIPLQPEP